MGGCGKRRKEGGGEGLAIRPASITKPLFGLMPRKFEAPLFPAFSTQAPSPSLGCVCVCLVNSNLVSYLFLRASNHTYGNVSYTCPVSTTAQCPLSGVQCLIMMIIVIIIFSQIPACTLDNILEISLSRTLLAPRWGTIIKNLSVDWKIIILGLYALAELWFLQVQGEEPSNSSSRVLWEIIALKEGQHKS